MSIKNKIKKWITFILLSIMALSCTEKFEVLNTNPNSPVDVPGINILANAAWRSVYREGYTMALHGVSLWCQHFAKVQYLDEDRYAYREDNINSNWENSYSGELMDLKIVIDKAQDNDFPNLEAMGRILKARTFLRMTDLWGDIPYSEAFTGTNITPAYDTQESIYMDLISELKLAVSLIDANAEDASLIASGDIIYSGDLAQWKKFANSLLLRIYIHISGVDPTTAQTGIETIVTDGNIFSSNDDDAQLNWLTDKAYWNPLYEWNFERTDFATSKTLIDLLEGRSDPRLPIYAQDIDADIGGGTDGDETSYVGQINGDTGSGPQITTVSLIGEKPGYTTDQPQYMMTYAEVQFILAEAALKGWSVGGTAESYYNAGIEASMSKWGVTSADVTTYLSHLLVAYDDTKANEQIGTQKWLALYTQGIEAFTEVRRTGYPAVIESYELPATVYPGLGVPLRFPYPLSESSRNGANYDLATAGIHNDMYGKPLWWDTRTTKADGSARPGID